MRILSLGNETDLLTELARVGVDKAAWDIFFAKSNTFVIKIENLSCGLANILKQTALALGADCALHRNVITGRKKISDGLLFANPRQLERIAERLAYQPLGASQLGAELLKLLANHCANGQKIKIGNKNFELRKRTYIVGILNITPDSFSDGGKYFTTQTAIDRALAIEAEGADLIDIGAESTRPGAKPITPKEELRRLLPVLKVLQRRLSIPISVDTYKSEVAETVLQEGAALINDISGLSFDKRMAEVIAKFNVPCIIMHIKGTPKTMQKNPHYQDTMAEIYNYLKNALIKAKAAGIDLAKTIVDPGIGFGKRLEDNYTILRRLNELKGLGRPILVGPSRKSFIGLTLNLPVEERLEGTIAACIIAIMQGANFLRVHDVCAVKRAAFVCDAIRNQC
ncbi:MAG: dihydropteroate synthase [candidate division WOR-3 bacterium]